MLMENRFQYATEYTESKNSVNKNTKTNNKQTMLNS